MGGEENEFDDLVETDLNEWLDGQVQDDPYWSPEEAMIEGGDQ